MEILFAISVTAIVYFVALYFVSKLTVDKWGARSGLFGGGIVNIVMGFVLHKIVEYSAIVSGYWFDWKGELSLLYYVLLYGFLLMGISGVVMIAVDRVKGINELSSSVNYKLESRNSDQSIKQKEIPAWKRIQMEQEAQNQVETE